LGNDCGNRGSTILANQGGWNNKSRVCRTRLATKEAEGWLPPKEREHEVALRSSAESSRFVETLPRRGYRFIATVQRQPSAPARPFVVKLVWAAGLSLVALLAVVVALHVGRSTEDVGGGDRQPIGSLAVLPLASLSTDPEQDYFAEGTTEALITELGKINGLRVISRQSMMQYKGTKKSASQIAHELNVEAIVEGSVIRAGDRVRISVQLIGAEPERHLWSNSYDRDLRDISAVHSEIAHGSLQK
jgi:TolB-like protein